MLPDPAFLAGAVLLTVLEVTVTTPYAVAVLTRRPHHDPSWGLRDAHQRRSVCRAVARGEWTERYPGSWLRDDRETETAVTQAEILRWRRGWVAPHLLSAVAIPWHALLVGAGPIAVVACLAVSGVLTAVAVRRSAAAGHGDRVLARTVPRWTGAPLQW